MKKQSVLGKGMGALLNSNPSKKFNETQAESKEQSYLMDINLIEANSEQPRKVFDETKLYELTQSIIENGVIQPIIVMALEDSDKFQIIAGERRFRASQKAGLKKVPVLIKKATKKDSLIMAIIENVQRSDLNCIEEALAYYQLIDEFSLTQEEVAKKLGKTRSSVANHLRLLKLPREIIHYLNEEKLSLGHGKVLASIKENSIVLPLAKQAVEEELSVRELEKLIKSALKPNAQKSTNENPDHQRLKSLKTKLEQLTGFHLGLKMNEKGKGELKIKFNNETELNDVLEYFLKRR